MFILLPSRGEGSSSSIPLQQASTADRASSAEAGTGTGGVVLPPSPAKKWDDGLPAAQGGEAYQCGPPPPVTNDQQYKPEHPLVSVLDPPFADIRQMCETDKHNPDINTSPSSFASHRQRAWPYPAAALSVGSCTNYTAIYDVVRATGVPNCMSARVPLPSTLNVAAWQMYIDQDSDEVDLIDYIRFGFPIGYMGPVSATDGTPNHSTAEQFPCSMVAAVLNPHRT